MAEKIIEVDNALLLEALLGDLQAGRSVLFLGKGNSMWPLIRNGKDRIEVKPAEKPLHPGKIVMAVMPESQSRFVVHRLVKVNNDQAVLSGDGNAFQTETCPLENIVGEIVAIHRHGGKVWTSSSLARRSIEFLWPRRGYRRKALLVLRNRIAYPLYRYLIRKKEPIHSLRKTPWVKQ